MRAISLLLPAFALLAACNAEQVEPTLAEQEAAQRNAAADILGADRIFGFPSETVSRLNQYGYRLNPYTAADGGYAATGAEITLSQSDAKTPNKGTVEVTGRDAQTIDRIAFALPITDDGNADTAKKRLTDIIRGFLFQYRLEDKGVLDAVAEGQDAEGMIGTAAVAVAVEKGDAARRIMVTLQRPAAPAPAETATRNIQQP